MERVHWGAVPGDHPTGYEAEKIDAVRWNGFAVPHFREEVARQIVADVAEQNKLLLEKGADEQDLDYLEIGSESPLVIRHLSYDGTDTKALYELIEADADGLYGIGGWCWTWSEVQAN